MMYSYGKSKERREECREHWVVKINVKGFEGMMMMYGTESDVWKYTKSEFGYTCYCSYRQASDEEVMMAKKLGMKVYVCYTC